MQAQRNGDPGEVLPGRSRRSLPEIAARLSRPGWPGRTEERWQLECSKIKGRD